MSQIDQQCIVLAIIVAIVLIIMIVKSEINLQSEFKEYSDEVEKNKTKEFIQKIEKWKI